MFWPISKFYIFGVRPSWLYLGGVRFSLADEFNSKRRGKKKKESIERIVHYQTAG
jgi:hypothetical protein